MKGTIRSIRVAGLLLGVTALLASSHTVRAQEDLRYNFSLPFEAQWQGRTLPAGRYYFSAQGVPSSTSGILIIRDAEGHTMTAALPVAVETGGQLSAQSELTIVKRNGKMYVQSVHLGPSGTTHKYSVPNPKKANRELEASEQVISVQAAGIAQ